MYHTYIVYNSSYLAQKLIWLSIQYKKKKRKNMSIVLPAKVNRVRTEKVAKYEIELGLTCMVPDCVEI